MKTHAQSIPISYLPTKEQATLIHKSIGSSRFVFNHFLAKWKENYQTTGKGLTCHTVWDCPQCNKHHDRDINAARNILQEGLQLVAVGAMV